MKRILSLVLILGLSFGLHAGDVIRLASGHIFQGKAKQFKDCQLTFKSEGETYLIPASDISMIGFENDKSRMAKKFYKMEAEGLTACGRGTADAKAFHGKVFKHVLSGIVFGPIGTLMAAIGNPSPRKDKTKRLSENEELFSNNQYLACYKQKAKQSNILHTLVGWVVIPAIIAIAAN